MKLTIQKLLLTICLAVMMLLSIHISAFATDSDLVFYNGSNINNQNYTIRSTPAKSALVSTSDNQLMRFQADAISGKYLVEFYDLHLNLQKALQINRELNLFGAFYDDGTYYYVLSGQTNTKESDSVEVYRLTKYDHEWQRLGSASLKGANTYTPFDAGSARIDHDGNLLFIRTCHTMYKSSDGYRHQANVTIEINTDTMSVVDSYYKVMNTSYGYVSHSFNQFIRLDEGHMVGVDHGDAYPRSVVLCKYTSPYSSSGFKKSCKTATMLKISGSTGANATGVSVGGFEVSANNYLVAGNTVEMGSTYNASGVRNIFVSTVDRNLSGTATTKKITSYTSGDSSPSTPHFVKVNDNCFILLWMKDNILNYCRIDGAGSLVGAIHTLDAALSDCKPIVSGTNIIWYTWKNETTSFYTINTQDLSKTNDFECLGSLPAETVAGTIESQPATIRLSATSKTIKKKKSYTLKISGLAKGDHVVKVTTSKKSVATVKKVKTNQYKIKGRKKGLATITVTLKSGKKAKCKIKVK